MFEKPDPLLRPTLDQVVILPLRRAPTYQPPEPDDPLGNTDAEDRWLAILDALEGKGRCSRVHRLVSSGPVVYVIRGGDFVKIGVATNLKKRLDILRTGSPFELIVLGTFSVADKEAACDLELSLHHMFLAHHVRGEWFHHCPEIDDFVALYADTKAAR
jgi:hypothetical protein